MRAAAAHAPAPCPPLAYARRRRAGTLRLPVKAAKGQTIASLAARLEPHGFYENYNLRNHADRYGSRLCLGNLCDEAWNNAKARARASCLHAPFVACWRRAVAGCARHAVRACAARP